MNMRYTALALAAACAAGQGWAGEAEAKKWIDSEFQPSTPLRHARGRCMKQTLRATRRKRTRGCRNLVHPHRMTIAIQAREITSAHHSGRSVRPSQARWM